jgi:hypothetical protein
MQNNIRQIVSVLRMLRFFNVKLRQHKNCKNRFCSVKHESEIKQLRIKIARLEDSILQEYIPADFNYLDI